MSRRKSFQNRIHNEMPVEFEGIWVPESLTKVAGALLAIKLAAYHINSFTLSNYEQNIAVDLGLLYQKKLTSKEIELVLKRKTPQKIHIDISRILICAWCKGTSTILHAHHHPIPKCKGGKETVNICPNCHSEFHYLESCELFYLIEPYSSEIDGYFAYKGGDK